MNKYYYTPLKEQIEIMQHFLNGGKCEYKVKMGYQKHGPKNWTMCSPGYVFDWECEDIRKMSAPKTIVIDGHLYRQVVGKEYASN